MSPSTPLSAMIANSCQHLNKYIMIAWSVCRPLCWWFVFTLFAAFSQWKWSHMISDHTRNIITSAKADTSSSLFVCLLATLRKNFWMDCMKFSGKVGNGPMNKWFTWVRIRIATLVRHDDKGLRRFVPFWPSWTFLGSASEGLKFVVFGLVSSALSQDNDWNWS